MNEAIQQKLLEKIQQSQEFAGSAIYGNYLAYLVDCAIKGKQLKETIIAIEFFGKDGNFNPSEDTIVRSHTYKLRNKLEKYYLTEGKEDRYCFNIPKGHYEIHFSKREAVSDTSPKPYTNIQKTVLYIILAALFTLSLILLTQNISLQNNLKLYKTVNADNFIWKEFIQSDLPVLIVPGDHFLFLMHSKDLNKEIGVRDMNVNSYSEFEELRSLNPDKNFTVNPEPYFPYHSIWTLPPVLSILYSYNKKIVMRKSSIITPQMLDEYNVIFVGSIKTLYTLTHIVERTHFKYSIAPHKIMFFNSDSNKTITYSTSTHSEGANEDLVLALKLPGPVNNSILIIASYHSLGAPEIANYLTDPGRKKELERILLERSETLPQYFEILFRVTGIDKTAYKTEILQYRPMHKEDFGKEQAE
jgi:hypothetical protein